MLTCLCEGVTGSFLNTDPLRVSIPTLMSAEASPRIAVWRVKDGNGQQRKNER